MKRAALFALVLLSTSVQADIVLPPMKRVYIPHLGVPSLSVPARSKGIIQRHNGFYVLRTKTQMQLVASPTNIPEHARRALDECIAFQTPVTVQGTLLQWPDGYGFDRNEPITIRPEQ